VKLLSSKAYVLLIVSLPAGFLEKIREICDQPTILQIVDELQNNFGETENYYTIGIYGLTPNI
jgi:acetylornithine/succinyldiaminopimelate/putrescine aminotransferase